MKPVFGSRAPQECIIDSPESLREFEREMKLRVDGAEPDAKERKRDIAAFVLAIREWAEGEHGTKS